MSQLHWAGRTRIIESLEEAVVAFLRRGESEGLAPGTLTLYRYQFASLTEFLALKEYPRSPADLSPEHLREFLRWLSLERVRHPHQKQAGGRLSPRSVFGYWQSLRAFFNWLHCEGYLSSNPMSSVKRPRVPVKGVPIFSLDQMQALLRQPQQKTFAGLRDWVMLLIMADSGLRLNEMLSLRLANLDWQSSLLRVWGKGDRERSVPFGTTVRRALARYLDRRGSVSGQDMLFVTEKGEKMRPRSFQRRLREYGKRAKIQGVRVSPHTFRYTFATVWLRSGGDLFTLQRILGHTTLEMVRRYAQQVVTDLQDKHRIYSPMDRMMRR